MENLKRIWLSLFGLSLVNLEKLGMIFGGEEKLWNVKRQADIPEIKGINNAELRNKILDPSLKERAKVIEEKCAKLNIKLTWPGEEHYPYLLEFAEAKPALLYYRGELLRDEKQLAIVGSRNATSYGLDTAFEFARELSSRGLGIVSGMARGVDTYAHAGALKAKQRTVAVLGNGPDIVYPRENAGMMQRIIENGAVVSEYPPGTSPSRHSFPLRNRIIAGMSSGILVTEAREDSGSHITINHALNLGREVFALPGSIMNIKNAGSNNMLKEGAYVVTDYLDILMVLKESYLFPERLLDEYNFNIDFSVPEVIKKELTEFEREIVNLLETGVKHIEFLSMKLDIVPEELNIWLLMLALKGVIEELPGRKYKIKRTFL